MGRFPEVVGQAPTLDCAVTVVVPTFNHERFIEDCLASVLRQQFDHGFHVVVHDDASTDSTPEILRRIAAENPDSVQVILQRENQMSWGVSGAELYLLDVPTPYFAFCEGDDEWLDDLKLEKQWRFMQQNPWCSLSHHEVEIIASPAGEDYARELREYLNRSRPTGSRVDSAALIDGNWIMTCSTMFRTSAMRRSSLAAIGDYQPEDFILFMIAADAGDIGFLPDVMARYRLHGANYWSGLTAEVRARHNAEVLWFLACHLTGEGKQRARERLVELLSADPGDDAFAPFMRSRERIASLLDDRDILLERVRHLEEKEAWLMGAKALHD
jgi:glycosyltransferase involved in cell wall biosynthesis